MSVGGKQTAAARTALAPLAAGQVNDYLLLIFCCAHRRSGASLRPSRRRRHGADDRSGIGSHHFLDRAGVDYSTANMAKTKLDAVADAAALAAVDHQAISGSAAAAQSSATSVLIAEAANVANVTVGQSGRHCDRHYVRPYCRRQLYGDETEHVHGPPRQSNHDHNRSVDGLSGAFDVYRFLSASWTTHLPWA